MTFKNYKKYQGFGLIEVTLAITVFAVISIAIIQTAIRKDDGEDLSRQWLEIAERKLITYAANPVNNRFPCPDTTGDGFEDNCTSGSGNMKSNFPYKTLGISTLKFGRNDSGIRYGIYRQADLDEDLDSDLTQALDRDNPDNVINKTDICTAIDNAIADPAADPTTTTPLYVKDNTLPTPNKTHIAFALAYSGNSDSDNDGNLFDDENSSANIGFNVSHKSVDNNYDDSVLVKSFADLKIDLGCP